MDPKKELERTNENCEMKTLRSQNSNESAVSVLFPWRGGENVRKRPMTSYFESGRIVPPIDFYLFMMAVLLLCTSIGLLVISVWMVIYRLPYLHLTNGSFFMEANAFTLFASLISIPCCWIAWMCHANKKNYVLLPLLVAVLGFSIAMLSIGMSIALVQKSKMFFDKSVYPPKLLPNHYKTEMNATMFNAMTQYDSSLYYRDAWNAIQKRFKCCGVENPEDWLRYGHVPKSCYLDHKCLNPKFLYVRGCLDMVSYNLAWEMCLLSGLSMITFTVQIVSLLLALCVYMKVKVAHETSG